MKKLSIKLVSVSLAVSIFAGLLAGCTGVDTAKKNKTKEKKSELFENTEERVVDVDFDINSEVSENLADFGLEVLKGSYDSNNMMVSPLSILTALTMAANGSDGITKDEFEDLFGMTIDEANAYVYLLGEMLSNKEKCDFHQANAIWVNEEKGVEFDDDYLQAMKDYYSANLYEEEFDDDMVSNVNGFVSDNTDKMIPELLEEINPEKTMVLINALAFEADWDSKFDASETFDNTFYNIDGSESTASFMCSEEYEFLDLDNACGFMKDYKNEEFKFVAILPDEDIDFEDFLNDLTGEEFIDAIANPTDISVHTYLPKFECEYSAELNDVLSDMGIESAFDKKNADFTNMTSDDREMYIDIVIHKTYIEVGEKGTKAAAATAIEMEDKCIAEYEEEFEVVRLDRPFIYAIVDSETLSPVFIGMVTTF